MATFNVESPDGRKFKVEAPDIFAATEAINQMFGQPQNDVPERFFFNPATGQMTSRELLANAPASMGEAAGRGYMQGYALSADDELMGALNAIKPGEGTPEQRAEFAREYTRARKEAAWRDRPVTTLASTVAGGALGAFNMAALGNKALGLFGKSVAPAATTGQAIGRMAAGGAVGGAAEGFASGEGVGNRLAQGAVGAAGGAILGPTVGYGIAKLADVAERIGGKMLKSVFSNKSLVDPNTGQLTDAGKRAVRTLGYNVDELSDRMRMEMARAAEDATSGRIPTDAVEGVAAARSMGIPLTKGQITGDVPQIALEENLRAGITPGRGYRIMREFGEAQTDAMDAARRNIVPGPEVDKTDAAQYVIEGVRREADAARAAGRGAYDALEASGAAVRGDAIGPLRRQIELGVSAEGVAIDAATPNARAALGILDNAFAVENGGSVPFMNIERARQRLARLRSAAKGGANGADGIAMDAVVRQFDDWLDDTITSALVSGDDAVLGQAKQARQLWAQYRQTFLGKEGADNYIRKIVEDDLSPDQVAGWLFSGSRHIGGGQTSLIARRVKDVLGEGSEEWQAIRRAAWDTTTKDRGPDALYSGIKELLDGRGKTLSRVLFSPEEVRTMREFQSAVNRLRVPRKAGNPSGTSYENQRAVMRLFNTVAGFFTTAQAGPLAGIATEQVLTAGGGLRSAMAARAAVKGIDIPTITPAYGAGTGAVLPGAAPEAITSLLNQERR